MCCVIRLVQSRLAARKDGLQIHVAEKMRALSESEIEECAALDNWMDVIPESENGDVSKSDIDAILEWLLDQDLLNENGKSFARRYWQHTYHADKMPKDGLGDRFFDEDPDHDDDCEGSMCYCAVRKKNGRTDPS
jgi:hypothetical protein